MSRCLRLLAVELTLLAAPLAALAGPPKPLVFEISYSKELSASPMDGHILLIISKGDMPAAAGFGVQEGLETQQAFGVDVDAWQAGTVVRVDSSTLGYPLESLRELIPGEYSVRAVLDVYETFHLGNGKVVKLPPDKGEGQHWQTKPGNFLSAPQKLNLDPEASGTIRIILDHKIPPLEEELSEVDSVLDWRPIAHPASVEDNKWEKHVHTRSELLSKFWGRPTETENLGPYGDAIMHELLPMIEKKFHGLGQGWARTVYGGSTGGWETLAAQVFYPDEINGAWAGCPDPIDFRAYGPVNIYEDKNAYFREGPFMKVPLPEKRKTNGIIDTTMEMENRHELVLGTHGRSGEQWDIWQAVFGPMGDDGYPKAIWDKRTGEIDKTVADYWREHSDLTYIMKRDWATLGPKLAGKLNFAVGDMDTWYLNNAVHLAESVLSDPKLFPPANATFKYGPLQPHCYQGMRLDAPAIERSNELQMRIGEMVKHIEETAPAGADVKSWKY